MPALLSAPSKVVPSAVTMSLPIWFLRARVLGEADDLRRVARQHDVAALVVAHDLRLDAGARAFRRGIHVRAEADDRHRLLAGRRQRRVDIAVRVELGVGKADLAQFGDQQAAEVLLLFGRGRRRRFRVRLRVDGDVAQEALGDGVVELDRRHDGTWDVNSAQIRTSTKSQNKNGRPGSLRPAPAVHNPGRVAVPGPRSDRFLQVPWKRGRRPSSRP